MIEEEIFHRALEKPTLGEQLAFLDEACAGQPELRQKVERLLSSHRQDDSFLHSGNTSDEVVAEQTGAIIGPYKLVEQIGEGGMGTVWMAQQTEPVKRLVAVKLIKAGMDSKQVIARFEAERQALALMDHPNIARVLDGGTTGAGRPYFVMDLVKGVPITRYCDEHHLTPRQRLELFVPVCLAVQHAHQKGIIHRDLKPSNVLVAHYDDKPVPKVIDFGVAKAAGQSLTEKTLVTGFGNIVGTLEHMSPEQAELNQLDIDTRSDIYSLGVLLYELLTGSPPFSRKELEKAGMVEMLRVIREQEPSKPSTKLSTAEGLPTLAANRGTEPAKLTKMVRGELDWIVMKALDKDRNRRYETANGFAVDVQRYLADEPVLACPPSAGYRLQKFVRWNKGPLAALAVTFLLLLGGIAGTTWGFVRAVAERDQKEQARADAQASETMARQAAAAEAAQRKQAEAVATLLESVFRGLDPKAPEDLKVQLVERLNDVATTLQKDYAGEPSVRARLLQAMGESLFGLGEMPKAAAAFERALAERRSALGIDHPETLKTQNSLAAAHTLAGDFDKALPLVLQALELQKAKLGPDHEDTLISLNTLAMTYRASGQLQEAIPLLEQGWQKRQTKFGPDDPLTLTALNNLAIAYRDGGKLDKALPLFQEVLAKRQVSLGPDHASTLVSMNNVALAYLDMGELDKAVSLYEQTLAKRQALLGPSHPATLTSMNNLAVAYRRMGKLDQALALYEQVVAKRTIKPGPDHNDTLISLNSLAKVYIEQGQAARAIPMLERIVEVRQRNANPEHPDLLAPMLNLASGYLAVKEPAKAQPWLDRWLVGQRKRVGADTPVYAAHLTGLAAELARYGQFAEAEKLLRESLAIAQKKQDTTWKTFETMSILGGALRSQEKYAEAESLLLQGFEGLNLREGRLPFEAKPRIAETLEHIVKLYDAWGKPDQAQEWRNKLEAHKVKSGIKNLEQEKKPESN